MKLYQSIEELITTAKQLSWETTLYTNYDEWDKNPKRARILTLEGDNEIELDMDEELDLPTTAVKHNMKYFFHAEDFQDVIETQARHKKDSDIDDYIRAINYYLENDAFLASVM
jgi:hypothetical protein